MESLIVRHGRDVRAQEKQDGDGDVTTEAEVRKERRCSAAGFEDGERGHEPRNTAASKSQKGQGIRFSPMLPERMQPTP